MSVSLYLCFEALHRTLYYAIHGSGPLRTPRRTNGEVVAISLSHCQSYSSNGPTITPGCLPHRSRCVRRLNHVCNSCLLSAYIRPLFRRYSAAATDTKVFDISEPLICHGCLFSTLFIFYGGLCKTIISICNVFVLVLTIVSSVVSSPHKGTHRLHTGSAGQPRLKYHRARR